MKVWFSGFELFNSITKVVLPESKWGQMTLSRERPDACVIVSGGIHLYSSPKPYFMSVLFVVGRVCLVVSPWGAVKYQSGR